MSARVGVVTTPPSSVSPSIIAAPNPNAKPPSSCPRCPLGLITVPMSTAITASTTSTAPVASSTRTSTAHAQKLLPPSSRAFHRTSPRRSSSSSKPGSGPIRRATSSNVATARPRGAVNQRIVAEDDLRVRHQARRRNPLVDPATKALGKDFDSSAGEMGRLAATHTRGRRCLVRCHVPDGHPASSTDAHAAKTRRATVQAPPPWSGSPVTISSSPSSWIRSRIVSLPPLKCRAPMATPSPCPVGRARCQSMARSTACRASSART